MKLKDGFCTQNVGEAQVMVAVSENVKHFTGMVRSNETAAFVVECLKNETTVDEILEKLSKEYDGNIEEMRNDIIATIEKLKSIDAIKE